MIDDTSCPSRTGKGCKSQPKLTLEQEDQFLGRYFAGELMRSLMADFGVSRNYYDVLLKRRGLERRIERVHGSRPGARKALSGIDQEMLDRYYSGESPTELAKEYGVHKDRVFRLRDRHGLERREEHRTAVLVDAAMVRSDDASAAVTLPDGVTFWIDEVDLPLVLGQLVRVWHITEKTAYVMVGTEQGKRAFLHRLIVQPAVGLEVDHKDRDGLNCRRSNLRECTHSQNSANRVRVKNPSKAGYRGVYQLRNRAKFNARITVRGVPHYLGYYDTPEEAAQAYDNAALLHFGEFAVINFPEESSDAA